MSVTLVLGGARSGKSRFAEGLATGEKVYIATAQALDQEMKARIADHQMRRGESWISVEEPLELLSALQRHDGRGRFILVDCLTLWLSNLMHAACDCAKEVQALADALPGFHSKIVMVSNEVGLGIVPDNALARSFRDEQGRCNQAIAEAADEVVMMVAGLPMWLKRKPRKNQ
jgi:adenosylcobinamide kinase / adenosylcobinamide-phosphate guanylyltransferase